MQKDSIKREQSQAGLSFAERKKFRPQVKNKLLLLLALLMTAATGAWAQTETLLTTITPTGNDSYSETTPGVVTVTPSGLFLYSGANGWMCMGSGSVTVEAKEGYTITKCVFKQNDKTPVTISTSPFAITFANGKCVEDAKLAMDGVTSIEVYAPAAPAGYTVSLKDGVKDADKWTISPNPAPEGSPVTIQYTGRLKVKGVKATSEAAAPSVPEGAINGKFSVSDGKQVYFSKGNLRYESSKWSFFDNQYDYYTDYSADAWDHFGWSTSATTYGMNTATSNSAYSGDFVDWGATMGAGWFTLTSDEWTYLFNTRSASTVGGTENGRYAKAKVNNVGGVILFPDTYTHPDGVTAPTGVNATDETGWDGNSYTVADWTKMETAGCVFLPAAGSRIGTSMSGLGTYGYYWSATPNGPGNVYDVYISSGSLVPANFGSRIQGLSVRLVQATSDAEPATVPVESITLNKTETSIKVGATETLSVTSVLPEEATDKTYTWKTSDETKATVDQDGKVTAVAAGTVTIYAEANDGSGVKGNCTVTVTPATITVTWNNNDITGSGESFTKDGVTITAGMIDFMEKNFMGGGTFTTTLGNFTKIEVTTGYWSASGTGWSGSGESGTWAGTPASSVSFSGEIMGMGMDIKFVFTIEPTN